MLSLAESYEYCRDLTQRTAHNFRFSFMTLPAERRQAMNALYAFNRITDDLGDDDSIDLELRRIRLAVWRETIRHSLTQGNAKAGNPAGVKCHEAFQEQLLSVSGKPALEEGIGTAEMGTFSEHPALPAITDMVTRYRIPQEYLLAVIDGVEMDLYPFEIATFADLQRYCFHVAGAVGLGCIHVWGFKDEQAISLASDCGMALQLTNILRDVGEDSDLGRIYLPREDLDRFGYTPDDLRNRVMNDRFLKLMQFQADRARQYYAAAERLFAFLEPPGKPILRAMVDIYEGLLRQIERNRFDVYSRRASLPKWKKLWYATRAMIFAR
ncbi:MULTISPECIES: phytoene/squalene synthase family protein [unclassified Schlesneria]|uniref:phytoene/squalene synthase family protein n=1 Tax=unclassified Schlesneria TaxID=2762017 RepID=UPI002EE5F5B8